MKKILLFGGSFDPIHLGHTSLARQVKETLGLDEVWFIPTLNNPFKDYQSADGYKRMEMIQLAIKNYPYMKTCDIELKRNVDEKSYTYDTVVELKQRHLGVEFYYLIGFDQVEKLDLWYEIDALAKLVKFVCVDRPGYSINQSNINRFGIQFVKIETLDVSSTNARNGQFDVLDPNVLKYISANGLYLETMIKPFMSNKRYLHTLSMTKTAVEIAVENGLDEKKVYIAGILHDIGKEYDFDKTLSIMKEHYSQYLEKEKGIYHQWISSYLAQTMFLIDDPEILSAIECHTIAKTNMSKIDMTIFCADKYDPGRNYDSFKELELCKTNIEKGFVQCLIDSKIYLEKKGIEQDRYSQEIYQFYVK